MYSSSRATARGSVGVRQREVAHDRQPGAVVGGLGGGEVRVELGAQPRVAASTPAARRRRRSAAGASLPGSEKPFAWVRITPEANPTWIQRFSSSGVSCGADRVKKPPMSEPHRLTPDRPMVRPWRTVDRRPSKPQSVVGSPPHTICDTRAAPVQPERLKRASGRGARRLKSYAAPW